MNTKDIFSILPQNIKTILSSISNLNDLQEIRIRTDRPLMAEVDNKEIEFKYSPSTADLKSIVQRMSNYSIYAFEEEIKQGYLTISGGHRIGLCGTCIMEDGKVKTIKNIASINIRVCKAVTGCSSHVIPYLLSNGNIINSIIISPPKCGKTTLIRDMTRLISDGYGSLNFKGKKVCVIDERSEIGACYNGVPQLDIGKRTDVLDGCLKSQGIMMAVRSMAPDVIVCDEIGTYKDVESILMALNCGVNLISTIHGYGVEDLFDRAVFRELVENKVFQRAIILSCSSGAGTVEYIYDFTKKQVLWRRQI
ncbi:MAG: stage sporulation protein [Clostridiaceae bacterium]|jgi:stage III sporulation protein AA|nr:stage sporulation protein [Clostridiaceae bacterium]